MTLLLVCLGAAVGAPARYLLDREVQRRVGGAFPWGTLAVNVAGCLVLGVLAGATARRELPRELVAALGTGFCGAFTTWSTLAWETARLDRCGERRLAGLNIGVSVLLGIASVTLGWGLGSLV